MSCPNPVLDEDGGRICDCGDEGRMCESCAMAEAHYWRVLWESSSLEERDPEQYAQDMRDAGRGHLIRD